MIFGIIASNEKESRFICVVADSEAEALQYVTQAIGHHYAMEVEDLAEIVYAQYRGIAELVSPQTSLSKMSVKGFPMPSSFQPS
jgi:hypothetical protein